MTGAGRVLLRRASGIPGRRTRAVAARLDVLRSTGLRYALRRRSEAAELAGQGGEPRDAVYRAIWADAAAELGAEVIDLPGGLLEIRRDGAWTRVIRQSVMLDAEVTLDVAADKTLVHRFLTEASLPVPEHVEYPYGDLAPALSFLERAGGPCVVKPASGTGGGWGITGEVRRPAQLVRATLNASRYSSRVLIERQAVGDVYRFLYLDGELLDVVRRRRPSVVGDGRSTLAELIAAENRRRLDGRGDAGLWALRVDLDSLFTLEAAGLRLDSVIDRGATVAVKTVTNENRVEDNETVRDGPAPELVAQARRAAELVGLRLGGVDIATADLSRPLDASGGVVIEVNGTPGLSHHYHVADRAGATRVALPILKKLLAAAEPAPGAGTAQ